MVAIKFAGTHDTLEASNGGETAGGEREGAAGGGRGSAWEGRAHF